MSIHTLFILLLQTISPLSKKRRHYLFIPLIKFIYPFFLGYLLFIVPTHTASASAAVELSAQPSDSVTIRHFKKENLEKYLSDEEFRYDRTFRPQSPNLWERFKQWLFSRLLQALGNENTSNILRWAIYIFCGAIILYVILKLTNTSIRGLIYGQAQRGRIAFSESEENIHQLDFEALIKEAVTSRQYNRAVRLYYLRTLKNLSDRRMIDWRINKTNHDYIQELSNTEFASSFRSLTIIFEYICYGDFHMNQADFEEASAQFKSFEQQIQRRAVSTGKAANNS